MYILTVVVGECSRDDRHGQAKSCWQGPMQSKAVRGGGLRAVLATCAATLSPGQTLAPARAAWCALARPVTAMGDTTPTGMDSPAAKGTAGAGAAASATGGTGTNTPLERWRAAAAGLAAEAPPQTWAAFSTV